MKQYLIGIDIGTSGTKSVLFDTFGNKVAEATAEYPMAQPQNGWAEQDPLDWWEGAKTTLFAVAGSAADGEIVGIGLSGQMHSLVLLDEKNEVIRPAILWCDGRTAAECEEIERLVGHDRLIEITANPALTGFTASKLLWVKNHEPENFAKIAHILLAKDYIRYRLTGEYATEVSDASGMQLLDVPHRRWSPEVCDALGIDMKKLPKVYESAECTGYVTPEASKETGLPAGLPVAGGGGDNAASAIGTGVYENGRAFTTIGTSGVVFAHTDTPIIDPRGRIHTFCAAVPNTWHVMGVTQAAGLSLNWFRKNFAENLSYRELDAACEKLEIGSEKLLYLPYLMGERTPILDPAARGVFFGLSALHTTAHLCRAVMEGVAYSLYDCLSVLREVGITPDVMAICGGGAKSALWRSMLADLYGMPLLTLTSSEGASLGAAILGGVAAGVYSSVAEGCRICVKERERTLPDAANGEAYRKYYALYTRIYASLREEFQNLQRI